MQFPSLFLNPPKESNQNYAQQPTFSQQNYDNIQQSKFGQGVYCTCNLVQNQQQGYNIPYQSGPYYNGQRNDGYGGSGPPVRHLPGCTPLPQNVVDQLRSYSSASTPIIIVPNGPPPSNPCPPCVQPIMQPSFIPYPMPPSIYQSFAGPDKQCKCPNDNSRSSLCELCSKSEKENGSGPRYENSNDSWGPQQQQRKESSENVGCSKKNCPAAIQLQAMISQLLGIQGIIPAAVVRVLLKVIPTSHVNETEEKIMEQATRSLRNLSKEQLLKESKNSQEIDKLLSLYLTSTTTLSQVIPVLTNAQLRTNSLRGQVEALINAWVMEDQGCATEAPEPLEALLLELKSDEELRQLLAALRDKECEERVNLNFAVYRSQRLIAQSRLSNVQRKIQQVENEINRRRDGADGQLFGFKCRSTRFCKVNCDSFGQYTPERNFESPDPFADARAKSPKRLFLKPHVGSPETTYTKPHHIHKLNCSPSDIPKDHSSSAHTVIKCTEDTSRHTSASNSSVKKSNSSAKGAKKVTISNDEFSLKKNNCNNFKENERRDKSPDKCRGEETFLCEIRAEERHVQEPDIKK